MSCHLLYCYLLRTQSSIQNAVSAPATVSFKDVIEKMVIGSLYHSCYYLHTAQAEDNGILFMPVPGQKRYEGKLLYNFGKATLFIDRGVVFVMKAAQWTPVSLDDLLRLA